MRPAKTNFSQKIEHDKFEPNYHLMTHTKCYWIMESPKEETPEKRTIFPNGCMEIILYYGICTHNTPKIAKTSSETGIFQFIFTPKTRLTLKIFN